MTSPIRTSDLPAFIEALNQGQRIKCNPKDGSWSVGRAESNGNPICCVQRTVRKRQQAEERRLVDIGSAFNRTLDALERSPVRFGLEAAEERSQRDLFALYGEAANAVMKYLSASRSQRVKEQANAIAQKAVALQYRAEEANGGLSPLAVADHETRESVKALALKWKAAQPLIPDYDKRLMAHEERMIEEACRYPAFIKLVQEDKQLQTEFFKWTLQDCNNVRPFIEFPAVSARLKKAFLACRIGRLNADMLSIATTRAAEGAAAVKEIRLPFFDGKTRESVSILDESRRVTLNGGRRVTIKAVLDIFANKNKQDGDVEIFGTRGIMNWDLKAGTYKNAMTGQYDYRHFQYDDWWEHLPALTTISKAEVERIYGVTLQEGEWVRCARANRQTKKVAPTGAHGFMEVAIPLKNGQYGVYSYGKFPWEYPSTTIGEGTFALVGRTVPGTVAYPDPNVFYTYRQQAQVPKVLDQREGRLLMMSIKEDMTLGHEKELPFQLGGCNCAAWAQTTITKLEGLETPDFFRKPAHEVFGAVTGLRPCTAKVAISVLRGVQHIWNWTYWGATMLVPPVKSTLLKNMIDYAGENLRSGMYVSHWGKRAYRSIFNDPHYAAGLVHDSNALVQKVEKGEIPGRLFQGNGIYVAQ